jgi:hypothetical protein
LARVAVTGLAATYPFGGVFWDYFQYVLGFLRLGHDVLYVEDTGRWCYDPIAQTFAESGAHNAAYLAKQIARLDPALQTRWFYRDGAGRVFGQSWDQVAEFCRSADLFVNISDSCRMREEFFAAPRTILIDSDPVYTQASIRDLIARSDDPEARLRAERFIRHDIFFTFGENIDSPDCRIPRTAFRFIPTRQPIVLECFEDAARPPAARRRVLTTVASWEPAKTAPVIDGVPLRGKSVEFERFIDLPASSKLPLEVAISGPAPLDRLRAAGWRIVDGYQVSADPWTYRDYLAASMGEFSVAKNAYVESRSGWFSCRSACYLALGVPVIVQDTGFACAIPVGQGILPFATRDQACAAIEELAANAERHARAALEIAREYFAADKVLSRLLEQAFEAAPGPAGGSAG